MKNRIKILLQAVAAVYDRRQLTSLQKPLLVALALVVFSFSGYGSDPKIAAVEMLPSVTVTAKVHGSDLKIATVDMRKVFESYHKTAEANMTITNEAAEVDKGLKAMMADADKANEAGKQALYRMNDMSISADERDKSKKAYQDKVVEIKSMQTEIERYRAREEETLGKEQARRVSAIVKEIREVLNAMAVTRGFDMVLDKSGETSPGVPILLYTNGTNDLTETLIKELNAGALPLPAPDSRPPDTKPAPK